MRESGRRQVAAIAIAALLCVGGFALFRAATEPSRHGTPSGPELPAGGITEAMAIEIATRTSAVNGEISPGASVRYDDRFTRWICPVSWSYSAGPTSGEFCQIVIDFVDGRILDRQCIYS